MMYLMRMQSLQYGQFACCHRTVRGTSLSHQTESHERIFEYTTLIRVMSEHNFFLNFLRK